MTASSFETEFGTQVERGGHSWHNVLREADIVFCVGGSLATTAMSLRTDAWSMITHLHCALWSFWKPASPGMPLDSRVLMSRHRTCQMGVTKRTKTQCRGSDALVSSDGRHVDLVPNCVFGTSDGMENNRTVRIEAERPGRGAGVRR